MNTSGKSTPWSSTYRRFNRDRNTTDERRERSNKSHKRGISREELKETMNEMFEKINVPQPSQISRELIREEIAKIMSSEVNNEPVSS